MDSTFTRRIAALGLAMVLASAGLGWGMAQRQIDRVAPLDPHPPLILRQN
ncbi:MAG: hypothetical protein KIT36_20620 [Alphaproteobacteria bacterium]|nr:hypothetical protein [Alphaproteobacteria bacterium]